MKKLYQICSLLVAVLGLALSGQAQTNIIENQTSWPTGDWSAVSTNPPQQNLPTTSAWFTGTHANLNGTNNTLVAIIGGSSFTMWTYFAPSNAPVTLTPSNTLQVTANFTVYGSGVQNASRHLRFGLLYSGPGRNDTGSGNAKETGVTGYCQNMNFGTTFGLAPFSLAACTNVVSASSILATTTDQFSFGHSGGGTTNDPGLIDGVPYTLIMTVTENATNSVDITTTILGTNFLNGTNITFTETDTNFDYTTFDTFCLRPNDGPTTATNFTLSSFLVETYPVSSPVAGPIRISSIQRSAPGSVVLTWTSTPGFTYSVYKTNVLSAPIATWPVIVTGYPVGGAAGTSLSYTDTTATATSGFYRVSSP
jgi:hypothetical protein